MKQKIWLSDPEEHDFPAAEDYLTLLFPPEETAKIVLQLKNNKTAVKKAKDILRASRLELLPKDNVHVRADLKKVKDGQKLSPVLLVRDRNLVIADGYHRVCAIYYLSEDQEVPCRIADRTLTR
jgi:disulfide oxidoreductase YuzD